MSVRFQLVMDVHDPRRQAMFWKEALGYVLEPPPVGFGTRSEYLAQLGVPEEGRSEEPDSIVDPSGRGPRIWFHAVPESKTTKNRLHIDIGASGGWDVPPPLRRDRIEAEVVRLVRLGATRLETMGADGAGPYAVGMADPEGNEFDIN